MDQRKLKFASALLPDGWKKDVILTIDASGMIERVEAGNGDGSVKALKGIAIPAVPNIHSHAHQRLMAGLAEVAGPGADSFWTWREVMYSFLKQLGPDQVRAIASQLYCEMLKNGYTAVAEFHYLHNAAGGARYGDPNAMAEALRSAASDARVA